MVPKEWSPRASTGRMSARDEVGARQSILSELSYASAQVLMDTLYACGVRPAEAAGSAGAMAAVTRHLNDLRCIVAKQLKVELK
jgi:hypothetical protein